MSETSGQFKTKGEYEEARRRPKPKAAVDAWKDFVDIIIFKGAKKEDSYPVTLNPQGRKFILPRDKWTKVPRICAFCLEDAVTEKMQRVRPEDRGERIIPGTIQSTWIPSRVPRFNWQWREIQEVVAAQELEQEAAEVTE